MKGPFRSALQRIRQLFAALLEFIEKGTALEQAAIGVTHNAGVQGCAGSGRAFSWGHSGVEVEVL